MVKFAIEIKRLQDSANSKDGGLFEEAQLQLIGLNVFNVFGSPPVVLTNLAESHQVLYLDYKEDGDGRICESIADEHLNKLFPSNDARAGRLNYAAMGTDRKSWWLSE